MQQADNLRATAHQPDGAAIMNATIGSTAPRSIHGPTPESTHDPKAKTASPASDDARMLERDSISRDRTSPERIRTSPELVRAEALAATLATLRDESETLTEVAHDARNMVTALGLYCEFL